MSDSRWTHSRTAIFNLGYHLIWCPKYRRKALVGDIENRLRELLHQKARMIGVEIASLEIMPDHIHLFVKAGPSAAPQWIIQQMKGYTSRILRKEFPRLKNKLSSLWTRSNYCESVGHISEETIRKNIQGQKTK